jgi:hypothetical protein
MTSAVAPATTMSMGPNAVHASSMALLNESSLRPSADEPTARPPEAAIREAVVTDAPASA